MTRRIPDLGRPSALRFRLDNRPAWADALLIRRVAAALLAVLAVALFVRGDPTASRREVVVAARDLTPGRTLSDADLKLVQLESRSLPEGFIADSTPLVGATLTGAMRAGETFTDLRIVGPRLAAVASGTEAARIVPIRLADSAVAEVLRAGDRVDVIGVEETGGPNSSKPARTLATDAAVVLVSGGVDKRAGPERVVLLALGGGPATEVAGASLRTALTVVLH
ncbi:SAF domain-containing protein [Nocardia camponoti]|uniref:SAF domain-containing protein n=1 Tax=Nocardia camponoti TaxID=1616106 RepID=A0A917V8K9_9NOCA|nr:SAF domain-containing protein [Nocardia camponoti]GGK49265.1 hypothetical protein GCM10011591_20850 [Nocardia camponoti]